MEFDWDRHNVDHITGHRVEPEEAEEALLDRRRIGVPAFEVAGETRHGAIGATAGGRVLVVVYTWRFNRIRVVTARSADFGERRRYRR